MLERLSTTDLDGPTRRNIRRRVRRALKRRRFIVLDVESRSTVELTKVGPHVYATHPSTEIWCVTIIFDDGSVLIWRPGDPVPPIILKTGKDLNWDIVAHNAPFDHAMLVHVLHVHHGWPALPYERFVCTMARSLAVGLPPGLGLLSSVALKLTHTKDKAGARKMRAMAKPRIPRKHEDPAAGPFYYDSPALRRDLEDYSVLDGLTTRDVHVHNHVPKLSPEERGMELHTHTVNERGFQVDVGLARSHLQARG